MWCRSCFHSTCKLCGAGIKPGHHMHFSSLKNPPSPIVYISITAKFRNAYAVILHQDTHLEWVDFPFHLEGQSERCPSLRAEATQDGSSLLGLRIRSCVGPAVLRATWLPSQCLGASRASPPGRGYLGHHVVLGIKLDLATCNVSTTIHIICRDPWKNFIIYKSMIKLLHYMKGVISPGFK